MNRETYFIGLILVGVACFAAGVTLGANVLGPSTGKNWIDFLAMMGGWVSGVGALIAVVAALRIADWQASNEHMQDAVRCIHHALATTNDLRGRLHAMKLMLTEGGRPYLALVKNSRAIEQRYASLYDRDIYRHAPGDVVDLITGLSGAFFGLFVLVEGISGVASQNVLSTIPAVAGDTKARLEKAFSALEGDLDALFTKFSDMRQALERG